MVGGGLFVANIYPICRLYDFVSDLIEHELGCHNYVGDIVHRSFEK